MQTIRLYKYQGENGVIVSPCKLPLAHTPMLRLIAEEGMRLEREGVYAPAVDVEAEQAAEWREQPAPAGW